LQKNRVGRRAIFYYPYIGTSAEKLNIKHRDAIEDPCSKLQGIFDRKEVCHFQIRSLTPQQAAGNALAFAVQRSRLLAWEDIDVTPMDVSSRAHPAT
jgi:hypothetical protein